MKKRIVSALISVCFFSALLTACSTSENTKQPQTNPTTDNTQKAVVLQCENPILLDDPGQGDLTTINLLSDSTAHVEFCAQPPIRVYLSDQDYPDEIYVHFYSRFDATMVLSEDGETAEITYDWRKNAAIKYDTSVVDDSALVEKLKSTLKASASNDKRFSAEDVENMLNNKYGPTIEDVDDFGCKRSMTVRLDKKNRSFAVLTDTFHSDDDASKTVVYYEGTQKVKRERYDAGGNLIAEETLS